MIGRDGVKEISDENIFHLLPKKFSLLELKTVVRFLENRLRRERQLRKS